MFTKIDFISLYVSNLNRSVEFYRDVLCLDLISCDRDEAELRTGTTRLLLYSGGDIDQSIKLNWPKTFAPEEEISSHSVNRKRRRRAAGQISLGFAVFNIDNVYASLRARGVRFLSPPFESDEMGVLMAVCLDPDGLPITIVGTIEISHNA